jgi:uncharacterized protein (TIGR02594 family)
MAYDAITEAVQHRLAAKGWYTGAIDGLYGPQTEAALVAVKSALGYVARPAPLILTLQRLYGEDAPQAPRKDTPKPLADEPSWITIARSYIGEREIKGSRHNPLIVKWWQDIGAGWFTDDETPWCGAFVGGVLKEAGYPILSGAEAPRALAWSGYGKRLTKPATGCIVIFTRTGGGHVGFVVGEDKSGRLMVLGGNQSDAVNIKPFDRSRVDAYRYPPGATVPTAPLPIVDANGVPSSNNEA